MTRSTLSCLLPAAIILFIFVAPGCMTFRTSDRKMRRKFFDQGVLLETKTVTVNGRHLHYAKTGSDTMPTIVFIHGTPGSWNAFAGYMLDEKLRSQFRMISIDRPGFGYSDFGLPENLRNQSKLIVPLLQSLDNGKPIHLAGHSLGGPLIIQLAVDYPTSIGSLVMISGSVDPKLEKKEIWRPLLFSTPLNLLLPGAFKPSNRELWYLKKDLQVLEKAFAKVTCPVIFIHGDKDTWVPPENVEYAKRLLTNSRKIEQYMLSGGNHFIPWTRFDEIRTVLLSLRNAEYDLAATGTF